MNPVNPTKRANYRQIALNHYRDRWFCVHCGFGIAALLEVAHLDGCRQNNDVKNLALLCPTCHKMLDLDLITPESIIHLRDNPRAVSWAKRMKDAGQKALLTRRRRQTALRRKRHLAAVKAAATRARLRPGAQTHA
jgi:hypothetical protein